MDIKELIKKAIDDGIDITGELKEKSIDVPSWNKLVKEFDPTQHPVMDTEHYADIPLYEERDSDEVDEFGRKTKTRVCTGTEKVSRVTYDLQALAVKRITELCFGVPVKRIYKPEEGNEKQEEVAKYLEAIFTRARIDSLNIERGRKLFASCEVMTLWYSVEEANNLYGFDSKLRLRVATFSPMQGDELYPLFDETGDLVALSVNYKRKVKDKEITLFDTYTAERHLRWSNEEGQGNSSMKLITNEEIKIQKIPAIYIYRPLPVWENTSPLVYEMEWAVSRNGNYLRQNSRPILMAAVSEELQLEQSPTTDRAFRDVVQYPAGSDLKYVTWPQAIDNLKFYIYELRQMFFTQLQLPDWSYENMKTSPMSGEARKQLFIDCHLKVKDESGRFIEAFDREVNVVKAFLKQMLPNSYEKDIDALRVENVITPDIIADELEDVKLLLLKNGSKPLMSQRESIRELGQTEDVDNTMKEIQEESMVDALGLAQ